MTQPLPQTGRVEERPTNEPITEAWLTPHRFALFLALVIVAAFPGALLGRETFVIRDFGLFSYPCAFFQRESFWHGHLPLWDPLNRCGTPFLAQWNTMCLYPFSLIYLLLPLTWSLPFFCLVHLFWGGLGTYFLARRWTRNWLAAGLAGIVFSFNGLSLNFLMWPSHEATLGWLPWVLYFGQPAWREGGKRLFLAIGAGAMQMLAGGPETIFLTWLILWTWAWRDAFQTKEERTKILLRFHAMALVVALICAAQLLPFVQLLLRSQRDTGEEASHWPMPIWGWANFLVPLFRSIPTAQGLFQQTDQYWTSSYYLGTATVVLVLVCAVRLKRRSVWLLTAALLASLVLALGDKGRLYSALRFCLPALRVVRYPVKFVLVTVSLAPLLAAGGFSTLTRKDSKSGRFELGCAIAILLMIGLIVWVAWQFPFPEADWNATWHNGVIRAGFLVLLVVGAAAFIRAAGPRRIAFGSLILVLVWLDLITANPGQNPTAPPTIYAPGWASAQLAWNPQPTNGQARVMLGGLAQQVLRNQVLPNPGQNLLLNRLAFFANCNLLENVPQVFGFFSLAPRESYRATMLPYIYIRQDFSPLLDFMAVTRTTEPGKTVDWISRSTSMPFVTAGQAPTFVDDKGAFDALCQTNTDFRQRVFLPLEAKTSIAATRQAAARILASDFANQRVSVQVETPAPALVVISQTYYPAWKARVDGQAAKIWRANYAFQAVEVPAGRHQLSLEYVDRPFICGLLISGAAVLGWLILGLRARLPSR